MKFLLDTHVLIWALQDVSKLPSNAKTIIEHPDNEIFYSVLSVFEVDLKHAIHPDKISVTGEELLSYCKAAGFHKMSLDIPHVLAVKNLKRIAGTPPHKDPFDKLMLCQAIVENARFMTHDKRIKEYDTPIVYKV